MELFTSGYIRIIENRIDGIRVSDLNLKINKESNDFLIKNF